jgi:thiamine biosynthesis protein ThiS
MHFFINGLPKELEISSETPTVADVIQALALKGDRVAIERNEEIVSRSAWASTAVADGDRFEIVHFVGGGLR